ncbi:hypothetical protein [Nocardia australiensis]|uniref:hypothetical protein n=1 Tax=Nocardia australiensis TaxID=2887191 RepID=UPI001D15BE83|nr:hypothetical protein [Nocardia australiensis]
MAAYSTTRLRDTASDATAAATATSQRMESKPPVRSLSAILSRALAWLIFLGGVAGAILGIADLRVLIAVAGLILACTAGLVLLRLRTTGGESD